MQESSNTASTEETKVETTVSITSPEVSTADATEGKSTNFLEDVTEATMEIDE